MPIYNFECTHGHQTEELYGMDGRPAFSLCGTCGEQSTRTITAAVVQTLATHMAGSKGMHVDGMGEYVDHNLGPKPVVVKDLAHKNRLMKDAGVYALGDTYSSKQADKWSRNPVSVSG